MEDLDFEILMYEKGATDIIPSDPDLTCLKCGVLHCGYKVQKIKNGATKECSLVKKKHRNKYRKLQNYVYFNLKKYGNSVIAENIYNKLGKENIKKDLAQNGFEDIYISRGSFGSLIVTATYNIERDEIYAKSNN